MKGKKKRQEGKGKREPSIFAWMFLLLVVPNDVPVLLAVIKKQLLARSNVADGSEQVTELSICKHNVLCGVVPFRASAVVDETCLMF